MTVAELCDRLSRDEFIGWLAYYGLLADEEKMREHQRSVKP